MVVQQLKKEEKDQLSSARRYYTLLSAFNDMKLTEREIQLLAFTAVKGNISYSTNREEFCKMFKSSGPTINNMISKLKRLGVLVKDSAKIKVNPAILLDFNKDVGLIIKIVKGGEQAK